MRLAALRRQPRRPRPRRHALLPLALALAFGLAPLGCASDQGEASPASTTAASPRTARESPLPLPEPGLLLRVERVIDGDTIDLATGERVRVLGIDAPERRDPDGGVRLMAEEAKQRLTALASGQAVRVVVATPESPRDRYGRLLAHVEVPGLAEPDVGAVLLAEGLAVPYPAAHPRAAHYRSLAERARHEGVGLWRPDVMRAMGLLADADITPADAPGHLGKTACVTGRIEPGRRAPKVHVLRLSDERGEMDLVIFPPLYDEIPDELVRAWASAPVAVTGKIEQYRGRPQIILRDPFQVRSLSP